MSARIGIRKAAHTVETFCQISFLVFVICIGIFRENDLHLQDVVRFHFCQRVNSIIRIRFIPAGYNDLAGAVLTVLRMTSEEDKRPSSEV